MTFSRLPSAVLWDMDGTLIDSEPYWIEAEIELAASRGAEWTHEDGLTLVGNSLVASAKVLQDHGVDLPADQIISTLVDAVASQLRAHCPWFADAKALLETVRAAGIPCALVTMSYKPLADALLASAPGVFDVVVTGEQVSKGKPDPEAYLLAAQLLDVDIAHCVAIEDSPAGTRSAVASGAKTIGVMRLAPVAKLPGMWRLKSLEGIGLDDLASALAGEHRDQLGEPAEG